MKLPRFRLSERQILLFILVTAILGYGGAVLVISFRKKVARTEPFHKPMVRLMPAESDETVKEIHYVIADLLDPSLMSLPSRHGFSRELWERQSPAVRRDFEPGTDLAFLHADTTFVFRALLEQPPLADVVQSSAEMASVASEEAGGTEPTPPSGAMDRTVLNIVPSSLCDRSILQAPELPTITSDTPLRPTRVRVAVAADGTVRYAVMDRSSGTGDAAALADAHAVELARQIRFTPGNATDTATLTWGIVRFVWATVPPPAPADETKTAQR